MASHEGRHARSGSLEWIMPESRTQMVVERQLAAEGLTRQQLGREEFERRVWQWKQHYGGRIQEQIRREGASVDWSRERFTMDDGLSRAVRETFVRLWDKGLIYRGEYMVNWCPRCQTAISDVETVHEAVESYLWHVSYRLIGTDANFDRCNNSSRNHAGRYSTGSSSGRQTL